ncbi:MAG: hypothetical protein H0T78_12715 [Longispora sp.]|nr:hypothetical protein [Longispora sp. (in: high G+C Gram-positive bacteria)]
MSGRWSGTGSGAGGPRSGSFASDAGSNDGGWEHSASVTVATADKVTREKFYASWRVDHDYQQLHGRGC